VHHVGQVFDELLDLVDCVVARLTIYRVDMTRVS
jgi:hypothetical protein